MADMEGSNGKTEIAAEENRGIADSGSALHIPLHEK